jgi:hypothetical protein
MLNRLALRVLKELGLGAVALCVAAIVIIPVLWALNAIYNSAGLYVLLIAVIGCGIAILVYQARIRPRLAKAPRSPAGPQ